PNVPAPDGSTQPNYARHFATLFLETFAELGIHPTLYWASENYRSGAYDPYVKKALDHADVILEIYRTVSTVNHPQGWLPISVICENCGKIGTTTARDWDGREVTYECRPDLVEWATGCGFRGKVSPFGGRAKMVWNVDWAARWGLVGATIEGCGKDLATAGGSRDRADAISRRVFDREPPLNVPYEFLNIGGKKMSTSRGEGAVAHLALLLQVPGPDIMERLEAEKGTPLSDAEKDVALERIAAAEKWLEVLAPDSAKLSVDYDTVPAAAAELTDPQRAYLAALAD